MKKSVLFGMAILGTVQGFSQVTKSNTTGGNVNGSQISQNVVFTSGDMGGCSSLTDVNLSLHWTGGAFQSVEQVAAKIQSPSGTTVHVVYDTQGTLTGNIGQFPTYDAGGFASWSTVTTTFDDDGTTIPSGAVPSAGSWAPEEALSAFNGENPVGTWIVTISDHTNNGFGDDVTWTQIDVTISCGPSASTWNGSTSTDWNVASNWNTDAVPTSTDDVIIPSAPSNQPHVTLGPGTPATCATLTVESGATLTIDAGKALTASGAITNSGTIIIKADATGIGSFVDNGTISGAGSFQMEQYLTGSGGATPNGVFYYVSSPIPNATAANYNIASGNKLWIDDETTQTYPQLTFGAIPLEVGQGYVARMGSTGAITFNGSSFNTGSISETGLTRTGTTATNRGYNLVGNPYPSTVSWDNATRTNLETTIWYRTNNAGTMTFDTYNATGQVGTNNNGGGNVTGNIAPTQAVWVRVNADGNTGSVAFDNADRSHGTLSGIYRLASEEGTVRLSLSDGTVSDEQIILFNSSAADSYDDFDSQKFWASNIPQLYTNINEDTLTINGLNSTATNATVPLGIKLPASGNYSVDAGSITLTSTPVYLEDTDLNVFQNLNTNPTYSFSSTAGNIGDRFVLHFSEVTGINEVESNINIYSFGNQIQVNLDANKSGTITVLDLSGRTVLTRIINSDRTTLELSTASGLYLVNVETEAESITRKVIIK